MNSPSPSRPAPAHAHLGQTLAWLQDQRQNAEREASKLRETLEWLNSIIYDVENAAAPLASRAALLVENHLVATCGQVTIASEAIEALEHFSR